MRFTRLLAVVLAGTGLSFSAPSTNAENEPVQRPFVSMTALTENITKSKTPSEAVDAYAKAYAETGGDTLTARAFMNRMVDFGMPEMAEKQAEDLAGRTTDGMPYAVMAFASAREDKLDQAILHIESAVRTSPNDAFVARTAGQVLAWYDVRKESVTYSDQVQKAAEYVRGRMEDRRPFARAYDEVHDPIQAIYSGGEGGNGLILANTDLATLGAFSGSSKTGFSSPMALFYTAPYALFPAYNYWYQPMGANVYYYQNWWQRGVGPGRLFPFPAIDRDTRFMKLPAGGYALVSDQGTSLYQPLGYAPIWSPGYYGGYGNYYGGYYAGGFTPGFAPGFGAGGFIFQGAPSHGGRFVGPGGPRLGQARSYPRMGSIPPNLSSQNNFSVGQPTLPNRSFNGGGFGGPRFGRR